MLKVILYTHETCTLCEDAEALLHVLESVYTLDIEKRDIYTNDVWLEKYMLTVPVIEIAGKPFMYPNMSFEMLSSYIEEQMRRTSQQTEQ